MEDKRLEKRKEFFDPVKDGRVEREKFMVDLRKKRKQEMFKNKRRIRMQEENKEFVAGMFPTFSTHWTWVASEYSLIVFISVCIIYFIIFNNSSWLSL